MPSGLKRYQHSRQTHFATFSCYHRHSLFTADDPRQVFELALERVRRAFDLQVFGYAVMPEHMHLPLSEPKRGILADALTSLKQGVARRLIGSAEHFWQKRYYDFNVRDYAHSALGGIPVDVAQLLGELLVRDAFRVSRKATSEERTSRPFSS